MKRSIYSITRTALMLSLLIVLQYTTKSGGQFLTGSCVNAVLALTALLCGLWSGTVVAAVSPFVAYLFGIGPKLIQIVPAIAVGNLCFVVLLSILCKKNRIRYVVGWLSASVAKATILYLLVAVLLCNILPLKPPQVAMFQAMFSWPQLVTALIGGGVAITILPLLKKAIK